MHKTKAIEMLGGSLASAAKTLGVTYQAVAKWPDDLTPRIVDRLVMHFVRTGRRVPAELRAEAKREVA